jgi:Protein of unknown function (DUF3306)
MSDPAGFISRWSRLKHESSTAAQPAPDAEPGTDLSLPPVFDLASLPPIESIVASSDIRPFLQMGVPADVTQAALRSAWAADPAIRDFIGIAENQWDFNDPAGIPGFGPLGAADAERGFVGRVLGEVAAASAAVAGVAAVAASPVAAILDPRRDEHVDGVWLSSARSIETRADTANRRDPATETSRLQGNRRSHGSALPK